MGCEIDMAITLNDNSVIVKSAMAQNVVSALSAMGRTAVGIAQDNMMNKYERPVFKTGRLLFSIAHTVDRHKGSVDIGTAEKYGVFIHEGNSKIAGRPFLKDALIGYEEILKQIAEDSLVEGFM